MADAGGVAIEKVGSSVGDNSTDLSLPRYVVLVLGLVAAAERLASLFDWRGVFALLLSPVFYQYHFSTP
jgi:hypothetical protein